MKKKILVVEDDPIVGKYLVSLFKDNGYQVFSAGDVAQGLEQARNLGPDLITLDIEMPGEWGPRFFYALTQDPNLANTPVIVISGLPGAQHAVANAAAFVSKPFDPDLLLNIIKETLN